MDTIWHWLQVAIEVLVIVVALVAILAAQLWMPGKNWSYLEDDVVAKRHNKAAWAAVAACVVALIVYAYFKYIF
ncbi:MAG: hypothetical protein JWO20_2294 [Candidatus Angelobacter sp.]|jgi:hypothetical protein|nr:hypothetical protein [Candidatus Angelobacter sp.]